MKHATAMFRGEEIIQVPLPDSVKLLDEENRAIHKLVVLSSGEFNRLTASNVAINSLIILHSSYSKLSVNLYGKNKVLEVEKCTRVRNRYVDGIDDYICRDCIGNK